MKTKKYDIIILGGGPAGLSAGIYASRSMASTAIIDTGLVGGKPLSYSYLENYPGFIFTKSDDLMDMMTRQALNFNANIYDLQDIKSVDLRNKAIKTSEYEFNAKAIIIATGSTPKKLNVPNEDAFIGRGVSYCAICDGAFYKDKTVAVIGGGNSAIEEAIYLTKFAKKVYVVHRRDKLRADKIIQDRAFANNKIEFIWNSNVIEINGDKKVEEIVLDTQTLKVDGVFPYIGLQPNIDFIREPIKTNKQGFIITDEFMKTSIEGVFAIGDVRNTTLRQVVTATSDGAIGATYAVKYIE